MSTGRQPRVRLITCGLLICGLLSCSAGDGVRTGDALVDLYKGSAGVKPIRPGSRVGLLYLYLKNRSDSAVTLESVGVHGQGVGSVVKVLRIQVAPLTGGIDTVPGGLYTTEPPVMEFFGECHVQSLEPVKGYVLEPGAEARIWVVLEAVSAGAFAVPSQAVTYRQDGEEFDQVLRLTYEGSVAEGTRYPVADSGELACLELSHSLN